MKCLITGGTGFLGKYIVNQMQQNGNEVFITTRHPQQNNHILADFERGILDLETNAGFTKESENNLIVIHAAGKAHSVPKSDAEQKSFYDINVEGTKLLLQKLETLQKLPKSMVFISSVSVYGRETGQDISESEPLNATEPYGKSKIESEKLILEWGRKYKVMIGIARLPLVAGKNPPGNLQSLISGIKSGRYFRIGNGKARKSMVWAADIASVLQVISEKGGIYNLTDGYHPTFEELEDGITSSLGLRQVKKISTFIATMAGIVGSILGNMTGKKMPIDRKTVAKITSPLTFSDLKAREEIGWRPSGVLGHINEMLL